MYQAARDHVQTHRRQEYESALASFIAASQGPILEHPFMREYVWVVHVSGFRASIISKKFPALLQAHKVEDADGNYQPITQDTLFSSQDHFRGVWNVWANRQKGQAVQIVRRMIWDMGWDAFRDRHLTRRPEDLKGLPFMGPALSCHMARNLGNLNVVKPDLHLNRLAKKYGFENAQRMCERLDSQPAGVTDLTLFYAAVDLATTS